MTEQPDMPPSLVPENGSQAPVVIGAHDAADEEHVARTFLEAEKAGQLGITDDPRWTGPDGHRHAMADHDPGSQGHHAEGIPHHH